MYFVTSVTVSNIIDMIEPDKGTSCISLKVSFISSRRSSSAKSASFDARNSLKVKWTTYKLYKSQPTIKWTKCMLYTSQSAINGQSISYIKVSQL